MMNLDKTYYFAQPITQLQKLVSQKHQVLMDNVRTEYEKQQAIEKIENDKRLHLTKVTSALKTDWATLRGQYQQFKRERTAAADRSEKRWDFQRLDYARKSARDFLSNASLSAIEKRYSDLELSGDNHALRGFAEQAVEIMGERQFEGLDQGKALDIANDCKKMMQALTVTKEMRDLAEQGEILTDRIFDVQKATQSARSEYISIDSFGAFGSQFDDMSKGVQVVESVDRDLVTHYTPYGLEAWEAE